MILKGSKMVAGGKDLRASSEQSATPGHETHPDSPMSLWRLGRQSDMGFLYVAPNRGWLSLRSFTPGYPL